MWVGFRMVCVRCLGVLVVFWGLGFGVFGSELLTGLRYKGIYDGLCICCAGLDLVFNFFPQ